MTSTFSTSRAARTFVSGARSLRPDFVASLVVFLVALPLCIGVAVASGVPAELGLVTGIVGGLIVGALPGSSLQVSGPAAGLTVLVYEAVMELGASALGAVVLASGLLQILLGVSRAGRLFRAISVSVVQGMLAGIGVVLIGSQVYALADRSPAGSALRNLAGLPGFVADAAGDPRALCAAGLGAGTIAVMALWRFAPEPLRGVPAALVAVVSATMVAAVSGMPVKRIEVHGLLAAVGLPGPSDLAHLAEVGVIGTAVAFALIASAESLFSAAAVDQMHDGPRTDYDKELTMQGVGNTVCGLLGALPMTAVIVRSSVNVHAGARTKASRILHGLWLLLFAALVPGALGVIPVCVLAGVLVYTGWKLVPVRACARLWRVHPGETLVLVTTMVAIVVTNLLEGIVIGLVLAAAKTAWECSHVHVEVDQTAETVTVRLRGNATFLRLPRMLDSLERLPHDRPVDLDLSGLHHLDHTCWAAFTSWAEQRNARGPQVQVAEPAMASATR
jgi:MFS superfamily sulfate permease-like transporter